MSLVYIINHNENVLDYEDCNKIPTIKRLNFKSKYRKSIEEDNRKYEVTDTYDGKKLLLADAKKSAHRTMGQPKVVQTVSPDKFLRKCQGVKWQRLTDHNCCFKDKNLPPVPPLPPPPATVVKPCQITKHRSIQQKTTLEDRIRELKTKCSQPSSNEPKLQPEIITVKPNFIALNIENIKKAQVKRPPPRYVDTAQGDRHNLSKSGLIPEYMHGKNFGKVPRYLSSNKKTIYRIGKQQSSDAFKYNGYSTFNYMDQLSPEERTQILDGLKTNFIQKFKTYQGLSLFTDTIAKKLRKSRLENELRQLEQDIYLVENNPTIYISNY